MARMPRIVVPGQALQLQLYWETFAQCDGALRPDQVVCEVSCGRGGGLVSVIAVAAHHA